MKTEETLYNVEEAAKWCGMSRNAFYMHYRRGHIDAVKMPSHRLYFTRESVFDFMNNYNPLQYVE